MSATIHQIKPIARKDDIIPDTGIYIARILRLETLLKTACDTLETSEGEIVIWPKELVEWYEINHPEKITLDSIVEKLDDADLDFLSDMGMPLVEWEDG